jgi:hypothetical protein
MVHEDMQKERSMREVTPFRDYPHFLKPNYVRLGAMNSTSLYQNAFTASPLTMDILRLQTLHKLPRYFSESIALSKTFHHQP